METTTKTCTKCKVEKELTEFSKGSGKDGLYAYCKACSKQYYRAKADKLGIKRQGARDITGQRFGKLTVIERANSRDWVVQCDCGVTKTVRGEAMWRKNGLVTKSCGVGSCRWTADEPKYSGAHMRVRSLKGPADAHTCVECGSTAKHWSYNHNDLHERVQLIQGYEVAYSPNPDSYSPRCVPCHKRFDLARSNAAPIK